jgi:Mn2+/Fe2+ NRAMP family transporter
LSAGELIATTSTGAEAGFTLLWLILVGCIIKVFVQVEFGRYAIVNGSTSMAGLNSVPGPRIGRGNLIVWYWFLMFLASIGQLGGIVGGVGQAMSISMPLTEQGREFNDQIDQVIEARVTAGEIKRLTFLKETGKASADGLKRLEKLEAADVQSDATLPEELNAGWDEYIWATIITAITSVVLIFGRYGLLQTFSTVMVAMFTLITVVNLGFLQSNETWAVTSDQIFTGLKMRLPQGNDRALGTALATFGIIGVGASELITYPYWCLEKGYARFTGPRDQSPEWAERAKGWMRVMRWDAWCSMFIYTFATIAFYLLGAAILGGAGLVPEKSEMVRTLAVMYEPVFGESARPLFLFGAFAVLYSTFFVANASQARVFSDTLRVLGVAADDEVSYRRRVRILSGVFPFLCLAMFFFFKEPRALVLVSGVMQSIMLPMLAGAGLYFRYRCSDRRVLPTKLWDVFLWISSFGMLVAGTWTLYDKVNSYIEKPADESGEGESGEGDRENNDDEES